MTPDLRAARRALPAPLPAGGAVSIAVPREALLELVDGAGPRPGPPPDTPAPADRLLPPQANT